MRAPIFWIAAACAALGAVPVKANTLTPGLYEGTIGTLPIRVCFDDSASVAGTYYYLKHLKPIGLFNQDGDANALREATGYEENTGGQWRTLRQSGGIITGQWTNGKRRLPIRLKEVLYTGGEYTGPCESKQFLTPRLAGSSIKASAADFATAPVTILEFVPGPGFDAETVFISSFAIAGPAQRGDAAINANLRRVLPVGVDESDSGFMECMGMMHLSWGWDGNFEHVAKPEVLNPRWLGVLHTQGVYCGGAHPNFWEARQVFDRSTGEEADPSAWLRKGALVFYEIDSESPNPPKRPVQALGPEVGALVSQRWSDGDSECRDFLTDSSFGWDLGLGEGGMVFKPELPHVATACIQTVTVPWGDLEPYLSDTGKAVRDSLR